MKQTFIRIVHQLDPYLLLVWLLALPAATPLIQPNTIADSADGLLHLYRVVALEHAIRQGAFFPRWLPDLAYGYGLPLFVFYAPLAYYLTLALSLPGLGAVNALNASFILALLLSGTGVYLFTKELFGPKAGMLAGVAYVYAPIQLSNTLFRGSLPLVWAMAIFPFVFWSFGRLIKQSVVKPWGISPLLPMSALILGAALLMHNISSLLFGPLLGFYLGVELLIQFIRSEQRQTFLQKVILPVGLAGSLGLGLAAFFLLPATLEKEFAQVERVIITPDFDFRFNFVTLSELFSLPQPANTGLLNPRYPFTLGLAQVGLAIVGLLGIHRLRGTRQRGAIVFATVGLLATIFMMLPISVGVWERLPLLAFVQHPPRLLGLAAFALAILAGAAVVVWPKRLRFGLVLIGVVLIFVTAVPLLYPRYHDPFPTEPTLLDMMAYEHATGVIGTTSFGEYLPIWVKQAPPESPLEPMYQAGTTIERLDLAYLPAGARIETASYGLNRAELVIASPEPAQAIFHTFYFPGWEALIDGQPGLIAPVTERGLIGVSLPEGRHRLQLYFHETSLRRVANILSVVSLVVIGTMLIFSLKRPKSDIVRPDSKTGVRIAIRTPRLPTDFKGNQLAILTGLAVALLASKTFYFDRFDNLLKHTFDGTRIIGVDVSKQVNFGGQVNLLGYDLDRHTVVPGQSFKLTVYWQARQPLITNYSALAQLIDAKRHLYAGQDNLHPANLPTTQWRPWGFMQDLHPVPVPPGTPPGDYFLVTGLYDPSTWARLPVIEGGDLDWSDVVAIPVTVAKPAQPPAVAELGIVWPTTTQTAEVADVPSDETLRAEPQDEAPAVSIKLLGAAPERETIFRNDYLRLTLFWEAMTTPTVDYHISLRLLANDGTVMLEETTQPSHNRYPTTRWTAGERVRDNHALWIPPDFPAGMYHIQAQILDETGQAISEWIELGKIEAETPTASLVGQPLKGSQPAVYRLMENGRLRHIYDWPTYLALGYQPDDTVEVSDELLAHYPLDLPLTRWLTGHSDPAIYFLQEGQRYRAPDTETMEVMGGNLRTVSFVPDDFLSHFELAPDSLPAAVLSDDDQAHPRPTAVLWANGFLWTANETGLLTRWDVNAWQYRQYRLPGEPIIDALASDGQVLYMGTAGGDIWQLAGEDTQTQIVTGQSGWVSALAIDEDKNLWYADVNHFDRADPHYQIGRGLIRLGSDSTETVYNLLNSNEAAHDPLRSVTALTFDPASKILWVGTRFAGVLRYDLNMDTWQIYDTFHSEILDNEITDLQLAPDGSLWVATRAGLARYQNGDWENYPLAQGLTDKGALSLAIAGNNTIWVGGDNFIAWKQLEQGWQIYTAFDHPLLADEFNFVVLDNEAGPWFIGRRRKIRFDGQVWTAYDVDVRHFVQFAPGQPLSDITPPPLDFPDPTQDYVGWLKTWPRPEADNGRGIHFLQTHWFDEIETQIQINRLQKLGVRWTLVNYANRYQLMRTAPIFQEAGLMVVWRPFVRPYQSYEHWAEDITFLRSQGIAPYIQLYNEPSLAQEWDEAQPIDQEVYLNNLLPAIRQVYDAGGYVGLQFLDPDWLRVTLQRMKAEEMSDVFDRLFFVAHPYGLNHPPAYDEDINSVLGFQAFAKVFEEEIGFIPVMIAGEGGWRPGEAQDNRYPAIDENLHRDYHLAVFDWFRTGQLSNGEPLPDYFFAFCPWLISDPHDPAAWFDSASGNRTLTIEAVEAMPIFERKFSWNK